MVHKKLLIRDCQYFRRAFAGGSGSHGGGSFQEAQTNEIRLPDEDEDTMDAYVRWLYGKGSVFDGEDLSPDPSVRLKLYGFAERILHNVLADHIMNDFKFTWQVPQWKAVVDYWENAPNDNSPMKACLAHKTADRLVYDNDDALKPLVGPLPGEYFTNVDCPGSLFGGSHRVLQSALPHDKTPLPPRSGPLQSCAWHLHSPGDPCDKRGKQLDKFYATKDMKPSNENIPSENSENSGSGNGGGNGNGNGGNRSSGNEGAP